MNLGKSRKKKMKRGYTISQRKMNCHPGIKGKTASNNTCYTKKYLDKIKNAYNKKNPSNVIKSQSSNTIVNELSRKLQCEQEDCWLQQLNDTDRKNIDKEVFAPDHPDNWNTNPTEWLSNYDILSVLDQYENASKDFRFIGPTPIDFNTRNGASCVWPELCNIQLSNFISKKINKIGIIFNLDKHDESGSHWVSMFIDIKEGIIFYFDSAASRIPVEITDLVNLLLQQATNLNIRMKYLTNYPKQHQLGDTECGMYSLYFIITMLDNKKSMKNKIKLFKTKTITDKFVQTFRQEYFNTN